MWRGQNQHKITKHKTLSIKHVFFRASNLGPKGLCILWYQCYSRYSIPNQIRKILAEHRDTSTLKIIEGFSISALPRGLIACGLYHEENQQNNQHILQNWLSVRCLFNLCFNIYGIIEMWSFQLPSLSKGQVCSLIFYLCLTNPNLLLQNKWCIIVLSYWVL